MPGKDGVRRSYIPDGNDAEIGWIYDSSKTSFFPPKFKKIYRSSESRNYNFLIYRKDEVIRHRYGGHHKDNQCYKDFYTISAKEIILIDGLVEIEKRASEAIDFEPGQEIVTSLLDRIYIMMFIILDEELPPNTSISLELSNFLNCVLEEKEALLPPFLTDRVRTTYLYNGDQGKEMRNIIHSIKEFCRVLKTPFQKAESAYSVDGKLQSAVLKDQILPKYTEKGREPNLAEGVTERKKECTVKVDNKVKDSSIPSALQCSKMTKSETSQIAGTITSQTMVIESFIEKSSNTEEIKKLESKDQGENYLWEDRNQNENDVNTLKGERNSSRDISHIKPSTTNEPGGNDRVLRRGRSNSKKRVQETASDASCDTQFMNQQKLSKNENTNCQIIHPEMNRSNKNQEELSHSVNEKHVKNETEAFINDSQILKESSDATEMVRSITLGRSTNQQINKDKSHSTHGRSSSRKRNSVDKESMVVDKSENITQENCKLFKNGPEQDVSKEDKRNIKSSMNIENRNPTSMTTKTDLNDKFPKIHTSIVPRCINESGKLFGTDKPNKTILSVNFRHNFGYQTDIDKLMKSDMDDFEFAIKETTDLPQNDTTVLQEKSATSNEADFIDKSLSTLDTNSSGKYSNSNSWKVTYSSSNSNSLNEDTKNSNIRNLDQNLLKETDSSYQHISLSSYKKCSEENTSQYKPTLSSSLSNLSSNTSSFFRILEPSKKMSDGSGFEKQFYGEFSPDLEERVILLLGASGSGKTTLVNFVANYFEGVKTPDDKMVLLSPNLTNTKQSHTQEIKAYSFYSEKEPGVYFTFIDTPGLNDSSGAEVRDHVQSLKTFLANMNANGLKIHALGFVAQAHLVRLTSSERLVMDYVSTLFGEKVKENIITFVTFADNQENPPVVEAVQNYGLKTKHFLKFNNSILSTDTYEVDDLDRAYWRKGYRGLKKGIKIIKDMPPLCVNAMKALQNEVYSKTVVDGTMKDLEADILNLAYSIQKEKGRDLIKQVSDQIWELSTAAYYQIRQSNNSYASVEDFVTDVTKEFCQKKAIDPYNCLKYLTFSSKRGMKPAAMATLFSLNMVYKHLKKRNSNANHQTNNLNENQVERNVTMFCHQCNGDHLMERTTKLNWFGNNAKEILLKCKMCHCSGNLHGVKAEANKEDNLSMNKVLKHARNGLFNIIQRYSLPGCAITDKELLQYLMEEENAAQCKPFINDLLQMNNV